MKSKKMWNRMLACTLLSVTTVCASLPEIAYAAEPNTAKEEVVYANLQADGTVDGVYVVNIFELENDGQIKDYGTYSNVWNMTSTEEITYENDEITINASEGKLYYEGELEKAQLPWNIRVTYYLDSKKCSAEEIAGKSGKLKIKMVIEENPDCDPEFFDGYALQASLLLDTEKCTDIVADGATIANVGSDKQLTYTILPGKGANVTITANVTDFEMDGISINGIPLNLNIEVEDEALMSQVTELVDAIIQLDDGALELKNGAAELKDGAENDLQTGVSALQTGASTLNEGMVSLNEGILQIQTALTALNAKSDELKNGSWQIQEALNQIQAALAGVSLTTEELQTLISASSQIKGGITELTNGVAALEEGVSSEALNNIMLQNGLDVAYLQAQNTNAATQIQNIVSTLQEQVSKLEAFGIPVSKISEMLGQLEGIAQLLQANNAYISGTETYLDTVNGQINEMFTGAQTLQANYNTFDAGLLELVNSLEALASGMSELSGAINTLVTEYEKFDTGLDAYTNGVAQILGGYAQVSGGASQLVAGSKELKSGTDSLKNGTADLLDGISQLADGTEGLQEGTARMREETSGMDEEINSKIDELLAEMTGGDMELTSFVSDKNVNIEMVQFVIQTEGIQVEKADAAEVAEEEEATFWEKLLNLFGL